MVATMAEKVFFRLAMSSEVSMPLGTSPYTVIESFAFALEPSVAIESMKVSSSSAEWMMESVSICSDIRAQTDVEGESLLENIR